MIATNFAWKEFETRAAATDAIAVSIAEGLTAQLKESETDEPDGLRRIYASPCF